MNKTFSVELSLYADVVITEKLCQDIQESEPEYWETVKNDLEQLAHDLVYAAVNPRIPSDTKLWPSDREGTWYWDGVCDMANLITNIELQ